MGIISSSHTNIQDNIEKKIGWDEQSFFMEIAEFCETKVEWQSHHSSNCSA